MADLRNYELVIKAMLPPCLSSPVTRVQFFVVVMTRNVMREGPTLHSFLPRGVKHEPGKHFCPGSWEGLRAAGNQGCLPGKYSAHLVISAGRGLQSNSGLSAASADQRAWQRIEEGPPRAPPPSLLSWNLFKAVFFSFQDVAGGEAGVAGGRCGLSCLYT